MKEIMQIVPRPFDPVKFIGKNWSLIPEEHDTRCDALTEVDFGKVQFETCLKEDETLIIKGEENLTRLKAGRDIRLGATVFMGLWEDYQKNKENSTLENLYKEKSIAYLDFFGDVLLDPDGYRRVLYLCRSDGGVCLRFVGMVKLDGSRRAQRGAFPAHRIGLTASRLQQQRQAGGSGDKSNKATARHYGRHKGDLRK